MVTIIDHNDNKQTVDLFIKPNKPALCWHNGNLCEKITFSVADLLAIAAKLGAVQPAEPAIASQEPDAPIVSAVPAKPAKPAKPVKPAKPAKYSTGWIEPKKDRVIPFGDRGFRQHINDMAHKYIAPVVKMSWNEAMEMALVQYPENGRCEQIARAN